MLRFSTVLSEAKPRKAIVRLTATIASVLLLPCGVAAAQATLTSGFDNFALGNINGPQGWRSGTSAGGIPDFDQGIVDVAPDFYPSGVPGFGMRAWRFSNLRFSGTFGNQTFSPEIHPPVSQSGPDTEYIAQFSFITARTAEQPGLNVGISPDVEGTGARMSLLNLIDAAAGTEVIVWDTTAAGEFVRHEVAVLPRRVPHTIKFWIKLHPGPNNDVVAIFIDGKDVGQRFTTWENYYRHPGANQPVPDINTLLFRASTGGFGEQDGGYLFFGESATGGAGPGPPEPDPEVDKTTSARTVHPGGLVRYTITTRNRGRAIARNLLVCDRLPREETFVSADHRLLRVARRRCLVINNLASGQRMTFHLVARVNPNARAGRIDNGTDETDGVEPPAPPLGPPVPPTVPGRPPAPTSDIPGHITDPKPEEKGGASVDVVRPPPPPPAVTG